MADVLFSFESLPVAVVDFLMLSMTLFFFALKQERVLNWTIFRMNPDNFF